MFSVHSIMPPEKNYSFTSFFLIWMLLIYSFCLIAMVRTSSAMMNKRGESRHPYLVPDLKRNAFSFYPLSMMLALGLSNVVFLC